MRRKYNGNKNKERTGNTENSQKRDGAQKLTDHRFDRWLVEHEHDPAHDKVARDFYEQDVVVCEQPSREAIASLKAIQDRLGMETSAPIAAPKIPLYRRTYFRIASAAAVVLIAVGVSFIFNNMSNGGDPSQPGQIAQVQTETYSIEAVAGVNKEAYLADSTRVWVNEKSKLTTPVVFNGNGERHVDLEGEAYFDVKHSDAKPFFVHTEHLNVRVLGTEFNVEAYPELDYTVVSLFEGSVEVIADDKAERLSPGEKLTYRHLTGEMTVTLIKADTERQNTVDWRTEEITATQKPLTEILGMIANYYDVRIDYDAVSLPEGQRYTLGFDKGESVETVLDALSKASIGFDYAKQDDTITIYSKK